MILPDGYVARCTNLAWRTYDDEVVIMTGDGTQIHTLNKVASFIWELADGMLKVNDIVERIRGRFNIEESIAQADTIEFVQELLDKHLVRLKDKI